MKFINNLNLNKNELQNAVVHNLAAAPSNPVEGQEYYNTADKKKYIYNGTGWVEETSQGHPLSDSTPVMDGTASAGSATSASRADHVHPTDTSRASATDLSNHVNDTTNPHSVTKAQVGLGDVTNDAQVKRTEMGVADGVATLDSTGKVPSSQLPSFVDDVLEYASTSAFPATGEEGKIYVAKDTNRTYRWSGTQYTEISESLALGETSSTAYRGDRGKTAYDHSQVTSGNPHNVTAAEVGATVKITATNGALTSTGGLCTWTISNTINSADVIVQIREVSTNEVVLADVTTGASTITIKIVSTTDISAGVYKATIIG